MVLKLLYGQEMPVDMEELPSFIMSKLVSALGGAEEFGDQMMQAEEEDKMMNSADLQIPTDKIDAIIETRYGFSEMVGGKIESAGEQLGQCHTVEGEQVMKDAEKAKMVYDAFTGSIEKMLRNKLKEQVAALQQDKIAKEQEESEAPGKRKTKEGMEDEDENSEQEKMKEKQSKPNQEKVQNNKGKAVTKVAELLSSHKDMQGEAKAFMMLVGCFEMAEDAKDELNLWDVYAKKVKSQREKAIENTKDHLQRQCDWEDEASSGLSNTRVRCTGTFAITQRAFDWELNKPNGYPAGWKCEKHKEKAKKISEEKSKGGNKGKGKGKGKW